ncbi:MAG TPA: LD-carboxypeptidase [Nitrospiria bacterium]|nr:LD-carboxypeptidase [Nitrospiria bacterium]
MIKPRSLVKGGVIGVISPAGVVSEEELNKGVRRLEGIGFKVRLGRSVLHRQRYLAGPDRERVDDLHRMFADPEIDAIFCARGGSGAGRLIPLLDHDLIARHPKVFMGCSDVTTLLLYFNHRQGLVAFHGPMVGPNFGRNSSPRMEDAMLRILEGERLTLTDSRVSVLREGQAEGLLTGGCLTLLCTSIGTPYELRTEDRILFIEDTDEAPYKIDRMLSYLKGLGKFDRVRGVVFGEMIRCRFPEGSSDRLEEVLMEILGEYDFPVLFGFPSGHGELNLTLPFGIPARIDTEKKSVSLLDSAIS